MSGSEKRCPDDGACHHLCEEACFRVLTCVPLSITGWDDWPPEIKKEHFVYHLIEDLREGLGLAVDLIQILLATTDASDRMNSTARDLVNEFAAWCTAHGH